MFEQNPFLSPGVSGFTTHLAEVLLMLLGASVLGYIMGWIARGFNLLKLLKFEKENSELLSVRLSAQKRELEESKRLQAQLRFDLESAQSKVLEPASYLAKQDELEKLISQSRAQIQIKDSDLNKLSFKVDDLEKQLEAVRSDLTAKDSETETYVRKIKDLELELTAERTDKIRHESRAGDLSVKLFNLQNQQGDKDFWIKASEIMGRKVVKDDLKIVEGIGPKIEDLFHQSGISTWTQLSQLSVEECRTIVMKGGERYRIHDPSTWGKQSFLAANHQWYDLRKLQDELSAGREVPVMQSPGNA